MELGGVTDDLAAGTHAVDDDAGPRRPAELWEQSQSGGSGRSCCHQLTPGLDLYTSRGNMAGKVQLTLLNKVSFFETIKHHQSTASVSVTEVLTT